MQAADIFELNIDVAIGGMDQRKAHVHAGHGFKVELEESNMSSHTNSVFLKALVFVWIRSITR